jgi:hypothetical protein
MSSAKSSLTAWHRNFPKTSHRKKTLSGQKRRILRAKDSLHGKPYWDYSQNIFEIGQSYQQRKSSQNYIFPAQ